MEYIDFLKKYIPSVDLRNKIRGIGHVFSDWDRAAIIWNSTDPIEESIKGIKEIADTTSDVILREQILQRINYEQEVQKRFYDDSEGFIYALNSHEYMDNHEDDIIGYFADAETARVRGCKLGFGFDITKYPIISKEGAGEEDEYPKYGVSHIDYDKAGKAVFSWSIEMPSDSREVMDSNNNKRFENKYVVFPEVFKEYDKVRVIEGVYGNKYTGWVFNNHTSYGWRIDHATAPDSRSDYVDADLRIDYWDEDTLTWSHLHVSPIYLERINEEFCNSFYEDDAAQVIVGHDQGAAVWFQVADVKESDKIMDDDVIECGLKISVSETFFDDVLRRLFVDVFDPDMALNKNRFTYGMREEGEYLHRFEERILEHNFFTYDQMNEILERIDDLVRDGAQRIEEAINGTDAIQLVTFTSHIRHIMEDYPENNIISVMS